MRGPYSVDGNMGKHSREFPVSILWPYPYPGERVAAARTEIVQHEGLNAQKIIKRGRRNGVSMTVDACSHSETWGAPV